MNTLMVVGIVIAPLVFAVSQLALALARADRRVERAEREARLAHTERAYWAERAHRSEQGQVTGSAVTAMIPKIKTEGRART